MNWRALAQLKLLLLLTVLVVIGGHWLTGQQMIETFSKLWADIVHGWENLSFTAMARGVVLWVQRMGMNFFLIELPKRYLLVSVAPWILLWLLPRSWQRDARHWARGKKDAAIKKKRAFVKFLKRPDVFGEYAGWAIGVLIALIFLVFFYAVFWFYLLVVLGFLKMPGAIAAAGRFVGRKILWVAQKTKFRDLMLKLFGKLFRMTDWVWVWLVRKLPNVRRWWDPLADEEKLYQKRRERARTWIRRRKQKEEHLALLRSVNWNLAEYRKIRRQQIRDERAARKAREIPTVHHRQRSDASKQAAE